MPEQELLGVIVEVALEDGLDVVAAFKDGSARYFNYSGKVIVAKSPSAESNALVRELFAAGENVVQQIGPWEDARA